MTVFPDGTKERLHGHNYQLGAVLELVDVSFAADDPVRRDQGRARRDLQGVPRARAAGLELNPHYEKVRDDGDELEVRVCGRRYVFPREDVLLLPIDNVSAEALAAYLAERLVAALGAQLPAGRGRRRRDLGPREPGPGLVVPDPPRRLTAPRRGALA
jgi:6-pyruvoyltetrahydropterin/6-carboxytetrahydropterin synthase